MNNGLNPWADAMLGQLLICQWANEIALKTCDPQNCVRVDAVPDTCYPLYEPRLNPLEFHGRRHSSAAPQEAGAPDKSSVRRLNRIRERVRS